MSAIAWTVGRYVVETLAANGIDTVFGIPGVHNIELYRGLEFARLRHVLVRHEQNAGFAADGYARVSGCAAAAFVISGPGVTNALTAVAQAYSDSVPLLVIASSPARACLGKGWGVLHELDDQRAIAAGVAGLARSARGARRAGGALRKLVEAVDGYLITTVAGKGAVAESHPASLGASLPYAPTQELVAAADVVVAAGTELSETDVYTTTRLAMSGRLVRLDIDDQKLSDQFAAEVLVRGDAGASLEMLAGASRVRSGWRTAAGAAAAYRARIDAQFDPDARARLAGVRALREVVPSDGVLFTDMTQIAYRGNYAFAAERPGLWFHPSGYGALGYALPAAIGAKIAQPARAVVALAGDFGVQFTLQELMTAVELDLSLPLVVWNNGALGQIRDDMRAAGIAPIGVVARNPDFVALAGACGAAGVRVHEAAALAEALRAALARPGPTLVEAVAEDFHAP